MIFIPPTITLSNPLTLLQEKTKTIQKELSTTYLMHCRINERLYIVAFVAEYLFIFNVMIIYCFNFILFNYRYIYFF